MVSDQTPSDPLQRALNWLDEHINLEKMTALAGRAEGLSLHRMRGLAHVLGDPQDSYPVVHISGTNGKGSTSRMVAALLSAHGLKAGAYTSPHLEHITERITLPGELVASRVHLPPEELARLLDELAAMEPLIIEELAGERPSYFELLTALAFAWFAEVAVDVAVVEVGLLGRFDATNVVTADVAVITNVGKDHTDGAPGWRQEVAGEKAGIIKPTSRVVLGETDPELVPVFEAEPHEAVWRRDRDFGVIRSTRALGGRMLDLRSPYGTYDEVFLPLHGAHQAANAVCAIAAAEALLGRALDDELVRETLAAVTLPGRCEVVHRGPLALLDGAHNPDGARALAATLRDEFAMTGERWFVLGFLAGRDVGEMLDALDVRDSDHVVACEPLSPRALPVGELAAHLSKRGVDLTVVADPAQAFRHAWDAVQSGAPVASDASPPQGGVIVTGSLYTVAAVRPVCRALGLIDS